MNLVNKGWCIFGPRGSGKSWLLESILDTNEDHIVYDPMEDHAGYRQYLPDDRHSSEELNDLIHNVVLETQPAIFAIDEANKYIHPKPTRLLTGVADLVDMGRHHGISFGTVARRPVQFNTDLVELADALFFFGLQGKNDYVYMEDLHRGLGDAVRGLPRYHFVSYANQQITIHSPVDAPRRKGGMLARQHR
jgi:hypothetical protein